MAKNYARAEREAICELLAELGPDRPTVCTGWVTRDLAAHIVVRERRPLAAPGIVLRPLAGYTDRVQRALAARPFPELIEMVRQPPRWHPFQVPAVDRAINSLEMFIHHEDIRRGQPGWQPRELPPDFARTLWSRVGPLAKLRLRRFPAAVTIDAAGHGQVRTGADGDEVRLTAGPGELAIFLSGRQRVARVDLAGPAAATERLATARLGM